MGKRMGGDGRVGPMGGRVGSVGGRSGVGEWGHIYNRPEVFGLGRGRGGWARAEAGLSYKSECAFDR